MPARGLLQHNRLDVQPLLSNLFHFTETPSSLSTHANSTQTIKSGCESCLWLQVMGDPTIKVSALTNHTRAPSFADTSNSFKNLIRVGRRPRFFGSGSSELHLSKPFTTKTNLQSVLLSNRKGYPSRHIVACDVPLDQPIFRKLCTRTQH